MAKRKVTSTHYAMTKLSERLTKLAEGTKGLAEGLQAEEVVRVKRFIKIEAKAEVTGTEVFELRGMLEDLTVEVGFNAQPFWRRWWQTWRDTQQRLKKASTPVLVAAPEGGENTSEEDTK